MIKKIFLSLYIALFAVASFAQVALPSRCEAFMPRVLYDGTTVNQSVVESITASTEYLQDDQLSSSQKRHWVVYSDRNNNMAYSMPSTASDVNSVLKFGEVLRIATIENGMALVYSEPRVATIYPMISSEAVCKGWVPMENLLLWSSALATKQGIYSKTYIATNLNDYSHLESDLEITPEVIYYTPNQSDDCKEIITNTHVYYIVKRANDGYCLIANRPIIDEISGSSALVGWIKESNYITHNSRMYLLPHSTEKSIVIYSDENMSKQISLDNTLSNVGLPIVNEMGPQYHVSSFKTVTTTIDATEIDGVVEARAAQKEALERMENINLIFVMDGTKGMDKYFKATKTAINMAANQLKDKKNIQVGLVIYRDYADGDDGLVEYLPMLDYNDELLYEYLNDGGEYGIISAATDKTNEDALYIGLQNALDSKSMFYNSNANNLFIVVANCGNSPDDTVNVTQGEIIDKINKNNVDMVSFQVRKSKGQAWQLLDTQLREIYSNTVASRFASLGDTLVCVKDTTYGFDVVPSDSAYLYHMASYRYESSGSDIDTTIFKAMMVERIMAFNTIVDSRRDALLKENVSSNSSLHADSIYAVSVLGESNYNLMDLQSVSSEHTYMHSAYIPKDDSESILKVALMSQTELVTLTDKLMDLEHCFTNRELLSETLKEMIYPLLTEDEIRNINNIRYKQALAILQGLESEQFATEGPTLSELAEDGSLTNEELRRMETAFKSKLRNLRSIISGARDNNMFWINNGVEHYWIELDKFVI